MSFDWIDFFERYGVEYVTQSPNIGRGEVGIKCPFCGPADPSQHMSINLEGRGWMCRRARGDPRHRGRSPVRLIRALTGCSAREAARLVGAPVLDGDASILDQVEALLGVREEEAPAPPREMREPREFRPFGDKPSARRFARYMRGRGFPESFLREMAPAGLRYCTLGPFAERVIFLVHQEGRLVNWTGRAISPGARRRYQAHTPDPELAERWGLEPAALSIERCLLWYDELLAGGDLLEVVEGPMDALKLRMLGRSATCLFTSAVSDAQLDLLRELAPRFERRAVLLDRGAEVEALTAAGRLAALGFSVEWLPPGASDPGELTRDLVREIGA